MKMRGTGGRTRADENSTKVQRWSRTRKSASKKGKESHETKRESKENYEKTSKVMNINIGTFNIIDGRSNRLEMACWSLDRHNVDICFLTETKLNGLHTSATYGYDVVATKCRNPHQGGVALVSRKSSNWHLEDTRAIGVTS